jgi:hypothetical protein
MSKSMTAGLNAVIASPAMPQLKVPRTHPTASCEMLCCLFLNLREHASIANLWQESPGGKQL